MIFKSCKPNGYHITTSKPCYSVLSIHQIILSYILLEFNCHTARHRSITAKLTIVNVTTIYHIHKCCNLINCIHPL